MLKQNMEKLKEIHEEQTKGEKEEVGVHVVWSAEI
jgi:hypothetical protein